jgi:monofunctional biosynthetic peptidoglycan transglycosylase
VFIPGLIWNNRHLRASKPKPAAQFWYDKPSPKRKGGWLSTILALIGILIFLFYLFCATFVIWLRTHNPPTTAVKLQREIEAVFAKRNYNLRYRYVPLTRISPNLQYAVIAAEDGRFYVHHGYDWEELQKEVHKDVAKRSLGRGASTITQQLAKNMFLGTERSVIKKGIEFTLVPMFECFLTKNRILELYLNEIEWGPGVFGAEAASEYWYRRTAFQVTRDQAARLAAIIPNPLKRSPARENSYAEDIQDRMKRMGW